MLSQNTGFNKTGSRPAGQQSSSRGNSNIGGIFTTTNFFNKIEEEEGPSPANETTDQFIEPPKDEVMEIELLSSKDLEGTNKNIHSS